MKVEKNVSVFVGQQPSGAEAAGKGGQGKRKSFFVGNLNQDTTLQDRIGLKKAQAQKQAMKIVRDTFAADKSMDDDMESRRRYVQELQQEKQEYQKEINWFNDEQERLKGEYGVTDDSEEQKELELLRKCADPKGGATKEEREQAEEIRKKGLTEYQSRVLELDDAKKPYQDKIDENDKLVEQENRTLDAIRLERLKKDPMVGAQKQAEEIMAAASKEIVSMVVEDAKKHQEEEAKKREEQGEKIKEERERQEELIEKQKEKRKKEEELLEDMPVSDMIELGQKKTDVQQEVQEILDKMKLVAEDIKGAAVDEKL